MNLLKRCILPLLSAALLLFCSCTQSPPDVLESLINNIDTTQEIPDSGRFKDYRELYEKYKNCNIMYFKNTETAINTFIGQKYVYGITAYKHSDELAEVAEMFFADNSENTLNIYFALRGFEDKEYIQNDNTAEYRLKKNGEQYVYTASYDPDEQSFEISQSVNEELKDSFKCTVTDELLVKYCYRGKLDRTFISRVNKDGTSRIDWYEGLTENGEDIPEEEHGYIIYDGINLSGVIK